MSRHQTYRIHATRCDAFEIDIPARDSAQAIALAQKRWQRGKRNRFEPTEDEAIVSFGIDDQATLQLRDITNEDRARWAQKALQTFSEQTHSSMGPEALHDLLCDLGHYARSVGLYFRDELQRAIDVCEAEIAEEEHS